MNDLVIASNNINKEIMEIVKELEIPIENIDCYGKYKAKIAFEKIKTNNDSKLILVTAMNPTPYGEGKTTVSIGLGDALHLLNKKVILALRQPSMGPVFGMKGGATGGGYSQVVPMEDINLHFTGDFHAIAACNNLLSAAIDNHIKQGNLLDIDTTNIKFKRCLDINDRALREIEIGLGGVVNGISRKDSFTITAASEIMALFCLATSLKDLKRRLGDILIAYNKKGNPIFARDLKVEGAMTVLLKDAIKPNLVQTLEHTPALIHGGPFANIAHGCNSLIATKLGLKLVDYVVTEAGFGADLGAEKFFDIKCRIGNLIPNCVVLVATIKALKYNAGISKEDILKFDCNAVKEGLPNLKVHIENLNKYGCPVVVCLNKYDTDREEEIAVVQEFCLEQQVPFVVSNAYVNGGKGAIELANTVIEYSDKNSNFKLLYNEQDNIFDKVKKITTSIYRANEIVYSEKALKEIKTLEKLGLDKLPICIAKTQYSISDDPKKLGNPQNYTIHVKGVNLYNGAGFITVLLGDIMTMPGLPKVPNYEKIDIDDNGKIVGIF